MDLVNFSSTIYTAILVYTQVHAVPKTYSYGVPGGQH